MAGGSGMGESGGESDSVEPNRGVPATMLIHVHVAPSPLGDDRGPYANVEGAMRVIEQSGLEYEVGALGTTVQGPADQLWPLMRALHEACLESGARHVMTHIRILEDRDDTIEASMSDIAARITPGR